VKGSPLSCNIIEVQRGDNPKYEALSYAWSELIFSPTLEDVTTSTHSSIIVNLYDAFQAIRYEHASRMLWVDAICINQSDVKEKGHQVASMGKIYGDAWSVVVWLGQHKFAITRIIDILTEIVYGFRHFMDDRTQFGQILQALTRLSSSQFLEQPWYVLPLFDAYKILIIAGTHVCGWFRSSFLREIYNSSSQMALCQQHFLKTPSTRLVTLTRPIRSDPTIISIREAS
jgi:hypothetical protein